MPYHSHVCVKDWRSLVNLDGTLKKLVCLVKLFLLQVDVSKTPPCVVMPLICCKRTLVTFLGGIKVFICYILMTAEGVSVGKVSI